MAVWNQQTTCAETAAVSRDTSHTTTKQRCQYNTLVDIKKKKPYKKDKNKK